MSLSERFRGLTVAALMAHRATTDPERPFITAGGTTFSFGDVDGDSDALAASLSNLGIGVGDRVALVLPSCPEFVSSLFAAAKLGAVIVPLDPRLTPSELQFAIRQSEAVVAITIETFDGVAYLEMFDELMDQLPDLRYLVTVGEEDLWYDDRIFQFEDLVSAGSGRTYPTPDGGADDDVFAILFTSGTTGKPKGVELSHGSLVYAAAATADVVSLGPDDRVIGLSSLAHVFGIGPGLLGTTAAGASIVLQDGLDAASTLDLIDRYSATVQYGVPTLFATELREQRREPRDLSALRLGVIAGAPAPDGLLEDVEATLCDTALVAYSVTETASTVTMTRSDDTAAKRRFTAGRPLAGTEIRVLDDEGQVLPVESVGEIAVKGPGVMVGYHRQPRETKNSFASDGFLRTGDLGILDEDGYVHLVGRSNDVIIRSGFNIHPREIEERMLAHPAVEDAAVVGLTDPVLGEAICACIVPVEGAIVTVDELTDWCRVTLADYKVPDDVRFLDDFPRTGTGKIRRLELARLVRELDPHG